MGQTLREGGRILEKKVLEAVREGIMTYGDPAEILPTDLNGKPFDVLTARLIRFGEHLDTCLGEYFFRPVPGDPEGGRYFSALITLRNDIPLEHVPEVAYALSMLNFYIETGCFALNKPADLLVYKLVRTFPGDTPEETLLRECVLLMEEAYSIAARYSTPVLALAEGSMDLPAFLKLLKT